ncbi:MAG TPA: CAP domain-containing protein [Sphingomicrobium sp.]|nr:CAP domain-containing protein [Sphingomicrobium sp.]
MPRWMKASLVLALLGAALAAPTFPSTAASNSGATQFPARILAAHNVARAQAGVQPLTWDPALGAAAASYAAQLAQTNRFQHSDRHARRGIGENLWMGSRGYFSYEAMVGGWSSERRYFTPGIFPAVSRSGNWEDVGHYTQMVWPTTTRVGCAVASNATNEYLVCRYAPAGNIDGRSVPNPIVASAGPYIGAR